MNTKAPFFWLRKISEELQSQDRIPLFGHAPSFDWHRFSSSLSARLGSQHPLTVEVQSQGWKTPEDLTEGLGDLPMILPLKLGSLAGTAFWIMPKEGVAKFTAWMFKGEAKARPLSSEILAEGFYRFLVLQTLDVLSQNEPFHHLPALISEHSPLPDSGAFCLDLSIGFDGRSCWGRLVIDPFMQRSWAEQFPLESNFFSEKTAKTTELNVGVRVGKTTLSHQEWKSLRKGDFVLLDQGGYDPRKQMGTAYLTLQNLSLFTVKVKQNKIQLIDYAFVYEEEMKNNSMSDDSHSQQFPLAEEAMTALKDVPIQLTVELARVRMTLEKLTQLSPGNFIELPIQPEQPVKLTVEGKLVGHAELVHLGEALGLRILELGH